MKKKQTMSFRDAMDLVDDDMPDGAYFALAHELAGLEYGEGFQELVEEDFKSRSQQKRITSQKKHKKKKKS